MDFAGYRNTKLVEQLTRQGRITIKRGKSSSFDPMQFALLHMMASTTYDWPLDDQSRTSGKIVFSQVGVSCFVTNFFRFSA